MDPNGCVPSLKGLGVDLSVVKQLVQLPRGEEGGGSELWVTGVNPNPYRKHFALHRRMLLPFMQIYGTQIFVQENYGSVPDEKAELKCSRLLTGSKYRLETMALFFFFFLNVLHTLFLPKGTNSKQNKRLS